MIAVCIPCQSITTEGHSMQQIDPNKYIVFKRDEFERIMYHGDVPDIELKDAVVIRHKDVFAPAALYAYATAVLAALEVFESMQGTALLDPDVIDHMRHLADYFAGEADTARQAQSVIPT